jgi:hypothetical protein
VTYAGSTWTISASPQFRTLENGSWVGNGRGFEYVVQNNSLFVVAINSGVYQFVGGVWQNVGVRTMGCRLPTSPSGKTVLQQNDYIVDAQGGIWIATCSYFQFASFCPDFAGFTIEPAIILRNYSRFPDPGIRSIPEPNNAPWNLKWCGGQMYIHTYPTPGTYGRWQGLSNPLTLAPATVNDCGNGTSPPPPTSLQTGGPTTSTITEVLPMTVDSGQQVWHFQSVESPNWDTARWGTNTHQFNVTVVPGPGPLPVILELHSAGGNGTHGPQGALNTTIPGIYVLPVDLSYQNGLVDPVTGQGRYYSKWIGYTDANGIYQPVTADRVVRYVQWVLTQTQRWTPDPTRVYVKGASMGGGGAQKIALLYPTVFAAGISMVGWVDTNAWAPSLGDCQPGVRWKTATGPQCQDMLNTVYLVQNATGHRPPLFLTWSSNDTTVNPSQYPALLSALDARGHGYQAEWRLQQHNGFMLSGDPFLAQRVGVAPNVVAPRGSDGSDPTGARTNISNDAPLLVTTSGISCGTPVGLLEWRICSTVGADGYAVGGPLKPQEPRESAATRFIKD